MTPLALTIAAVLAAAAAAAIGHRYRPSRRRARQLRRQRQIARYRIAGQLSRDPDAWEQFWATHGLDDCMRGGA